MFASGRRSKSRWQGISNPRWRSNKRHSFSLQYTECFYLFSRTMTKLKRPFFEDLQWHLHLLLLLYTCPFHYGALFDILQFLQQLLPKHVDKRGNHVHTNYYNMNNFWFTDLLDQQVVTPQKDMYLSFLEIALIIILMQVYISKVYNLRSHITAPS